MKNKKITRWIGGILAVLALGVFGMTSSTYADGDDTVIVKSLLQGMAECYDGTKLYSDRELDEISSPSSILFIKKAEINVPTGLISDVSGSRTTCENLFNNITDWLSGSSSSLLVNSEAIPNGLSKTSDEETKRTFLENMGYEVANSGTRCVYFAYGVSVLDTNDTSYSNRICAELDDNDTIVSALSKEIDGDPSTNIFKIKLKDNNTTVQLDCAPLNLVGDGGCGQHSIEIGTTSWGELTQWLLDELAEHRNNFSITGGGVTTEFTLQGMEYSDSTTYNKGSVAVKTMLKSYTGSSSITNLRINRDEIAQLYVSYLLDYYATEQACGLSDDEVTIYEGRGFIEYRANADGDMCYVNATQHTGNGNNDKVNGVNGSGALDYQSKTFAEIVEWLRNYTGSVDVNLDTAVSVTGEDEETEEEEEENTCMDGAADSLGWIVCPILKWMGGASEKLYDNFIEPALTVEPTLFTDNEDSGTKAGWTAIRNIANVVFIIVLLIVIFSQLTGVGIDNYGIKKILPKMIVAAILINISYFVCVALVDVSNLVGNGLQSMFDGWASNQALMENIGAEIDNGATYTGKLISAGLLAAIVGGGLMVWTNPGILLALLVSALGVLISIFFLFIMLAAREAAIVVLIILSPLAVVCFMLPNTKGYFDKWWKFFGSLLMVYPIVGLLVGGGNFVSKLLLTNGDLTNFFTTFTAMIIGIVPIFFVPTVLRKSLVTAGDIGTRIQSMGRGIGGRAQGSIRNSEGFRRARTNMNAGMKGGFREKVAMKTGIGRKSMMRARAAKIQDAATEEKAKSLVGGTGYDAAFKRIESEARNQEVEDEIKLMADSTNNYDVDTMDDQLAGLLAKDTLTDGEKVRMKALMSKMATGGGYGKKKLAATAAGASSGTKAEVAKYMSKNSDVGSAIASKDNARGQYLRDINSGKYTATTSYEDWKKDLRAGTDKTNLQFVTDNVITDDRDFVAQSASAVKEQLSSLSDERLMDMVNNERLMDGIDSDVRKELREAAASRGIQAGAKQGEVFSVRQAEQNAQAAADEIDFVSRLSSVSDKGLNDLYENAKFRSTLSKSADQALEREYDRRTTPGSSSKQNT